MDDKRIRLDLLIHDLKGPLSIIESNILLLMERPDKYGPLTEKQKRLLGRVLRNARVGKSRVMDALQLGRSECGVMDYSDACVGEIVLKSLEETFDLRGGSISEKLASCGDYEQIREVLEKEAVSLRVEDGLWDRRIVVDRDKIEQILRNLVSNGLKYRRRRLEIEAAHADGMLTLSVSDDGSGIAPEHHSRIFEKYFQVAPSEIAAERGHGIGLAGALALARDLGGDLSLKSDIGRGACFSATIPAASAG